MYKLAELEIYKGNVSWATESGDFDSFADAYKAIPLQEKEFSGSWGVMLDDEESPFLVVINGVLFFDPRKIGKCPECEGVGWVYQSYVPLNPDLDTDIVDCEECAGTGILPPKPYKPIPDIPDEEIPF